MVVQNPLTGRSRGSFGSAVFTTWKGLNVVKTKAVSVANPNTEKQQKNRSILSVIVKLYRILAIFANIGFVQGAVRKSAYNAFTSYNILGGTAVNNAGVVSLDMSKMQLAKGTLEPTDLGVITGDASAAQIQIAFSSVISGNQKSTDKMYVVICESNGSLVAKSQGVVTRNAGSVTITNAAGVFAAGALHMYTFFANDEGRIVSDNTYQAI
jgi:Family of unknown function (DUF6266)